MAQPTNCDGSCDSPRLGHNNRGEHNGEKGCQGRQEEGREEAVVLQEALGVLTPSTPFFLPHDVRPHSDGGHRDANQQHHRPTCQAAECAATLMDAQSTLRKGGFHMAKKVAKKAVKKTAKKKAAKKTAKKR